MKSGRHAGCDADCGRLRFIPARTGNTPPTPLAHIPPPVHPRTHREHVPSNELSVRRLQDYHTVQNTKSSRAVQMSVFVVRAFIKMRRTMTANKALLEKLQQLEQKLTKRLDAHACVPACAKPKRLRFGKGRPKRWHNSWRFTLRSRSAGTWGFGGQRTASSVVAGVSRIPSLIKACENRCEVRTICTV